MSAKRTGVLWPSEENYEAFVMACEDIVEPTFKAFIEARTAQLERIQAQGMPVHKIQFDPVAMQDWCWEHLGAVNARSRAAYAEFLLAKSTVERHFC